MKILNQVLFITILTLTAESFAYSPKEGNVSTLFGPTVQHADFKSTGTGAKSSDFGGMGLIAVGDISEKGALEIGMFYQPTLFYRDLGENSIVERADVLHISMGYRRYLNSWLSTSMAFYSSYSIGDAQTVHSDFAPGQGTTTSARDITEYGFDFAASTELWSQDKWAALLYTRYSISVTSKESERGNQYSGMLALRYFVQEKLHSSEPNPNK